MSEPFLGEIRNFGFNFAPQGWAQCQGQLLSISQNSALFSLLGTMYGGDGRTTFGLPDLRGRTAISVGQGPGLSSRDQGQVGGGEQVTLTAPQVRTAHPRRDGVLPSGEQEPCQLTSRLNRRRVHLRRCNRSDHEPKHDQTQPRRPTTRQHAALPGNQPLHRPGGHLPVAKLNVASVGAACPGP